MNLLCHPGHAILRHELVPWLRTLHRVRPLAIVVGSSPNALSFVRSLGRRGVPVLVLATAPGVALHSRYATGALLPDLERRPEAWLDVLMDVAERVEEPPVVFATSDAGVGFLAEQEDVLRGRFRFLVPKLDVVERMVDKREQYRLADSLGVPIPRTLYPGSIAELRAMADAVEYPCILKPSHSHRAHSRIRGKVVVADTPQWLVSEYERLAGPDLGFVVQEIVPGPDSNLFGYLALWDAEGHELAWLTKRKLRQYPPGFGDGSLQQTGDAPEVAEVSRRFLGAMGYRGYVGTEFKLDERDGVFRLMEVNPRTVLANQLAIEAGVDFPWIGYRHLTGAEPPPLSRRRETRWVHEEHEVRGFLQFQRAAGTTLPAWLRSLRGVRARALWSRDDPAPFLFAMVRMLWAAVRSLMRRIDGGSPLP